MAKKEPEIEQKADPLFVAGQQVEPEPAWITAEWGVLPQWRCCLCPFDTLDGEAAMLEHWRECHAHPVPVAPPPVIQIYDKWGNPQRSV